MLAAVAARGITEWWCLGDLVGYGADPIATLETCTDGATRCLAGNHDLGVTGRAGLEVFTQVAAMAVVWTQRVLGEAGRARLDALRPYDTAGEVPLYHASPRDPVWEYVLSADQARAAIEEAAAPLSMVGHTHLPALWWRDGDGALRRVRTDAGPVALRAGGWLLNPGSVGQPRDRDPRASWAVWDPDARVIEVVRTEYDVAGAQRAILEAGLPPGLAARLAEGH